MKRALVILAASVAALAWAGELDVARQALRDGLWDMARSHVDAAADDEAKLIVLESLAGEGRWDEIRENLQRWGAVKGPAFDYYRAVAAGRHKEAAELLKRGGSAEGYVEARLYEAELLSQSGQSAVAKAIWSELAAATNVSDRVLAIVGINLWDEQLLRQVAKAENLPVPLRRLVGLRLGMVMLKERGTQAEGMKLIRAVVRDSPDTESALDAFLAMADAEIAAEHWPEADSILRETLEIWPDSAKRPQLQESRGWVLIKLARHEEALAAFRRARELAVDDTSRAIALMKEGDVLAEMGRGDESMAKYREVIASYPNTVAATKLRKVVAIRELEERGRQAYREFRFDEAREAFLKVAAAESVRADRMAFYALLCQYGQGYDDEAAKEAKKLLEAGSDMSVRAETTLWLAKYSYNRQDWREAERLFSEYAEGCREPVAASDAMLWAARATLAEGEFARAVRLTTTLCERFPESAAKASALLVQGEALMELARFQEALLVLERAVALPGAPVADRVRAQRLLADVLYASGADNPKSYEAALEAYRALRFGGSLSPSGEIAVAFKIARSLEKLKRVDEAMDQYYSQVVLAYRSQRLRQVRLDDDAQAAFSKAAFRLADEYERRGQERSAAAVLRLLATSDVPAAEEATKRLERMSNKGRFM